MTKICICDLDGVVADSSARFAKASQAKTALFQQNIAESDPERVKALVRQADDAYWKTAFTPDLVQLDTLMDGILSVVHSLVFDWGYEVYFLTSRPETMREATLQWLSENNVYHANREKVSHLIMKPLSQQFVKTPVWKAGTIEVLARLLQPDDLLVIDDEHAAQLTVDLAHLDCFKVMCCTSLATALRVIGE